MLTKPLQVQKHVGIQCKLKLEKVHNFVEFCLAQHSEQSKNRVKTKEIRYDL
ncbi:hypothetical protein CAEBREN_21535 [Caenorhabditis brenneri]|uniref:Uncharacterized protein n=1 Tax=Caenorhabditis brenneri TaxID=135651 RepID=G0MU65_CAEBE|nr:hypothetical protein CAEBREN_21535 [Caenorhabditis brenneri]